MSVYNIIAFLCWFKNKLGIFLCYYIHLEERSENIWYLPTWRADPTRNTVNKEKNSRKHLTRATRLIPNIQLHKKLIDKNRMLNIIITAMKQSLVSSVYLYSTYTRYNDKQWKIAGKNIYKYMYVNWMLSDYIINSFFQISRKWLFSRKSHLRANR